MSFLSNIFRASPGSNQWPMIAATISSGLDEVKTQWFNQCVVSMELGLFVNNAGKAKIINTELGDAALVAITAYQVCSASCLIAKRSYIARGSRQGFLDLLFGRLSER